MGRGWGACGGACCLVAPPSPRNRCFRRVRQRQSSCRCRRKSAGLPQGQVKFHLLFVFPRPPPPAPARFPGLCANPESATKDAAPPSPPPNPLTPARSRRPRAPPAARRPLLGRPGRSPAIAGAGSKEGALFSPRGGGGGDTGRLPPAGAGTPGAAPPRPPSFISLIPAVAALGSQPSEAAVPCTLHLTKDDDK